MTTSIAKTSAAVLAMAAALVTAGPAVADSVVADAPGARNLTAAGGWLAWATPGENGQWRLTVRSPDGVTSTPDVPAFDAAPDAALGSYYTNRRRGEGKQIVAVYEREGDIHRLSLRSGRETRVKHISTESHRETQPAIIANRYVFVRRGGPRNGVFVTRRNGRVARLSKVVARETEIDTRVIYTTRSRVYIQRISGKGRRFVIETDSTPRSPHITRYRAMWLLDGGRTFTTERFAGSGGPYPAPRVGREGNRTLPESTSSLGGNAASIGWYLDDEGVKSVSPDLFR
jgi:hypothetical protein